MTVSNSTNRTSAVGSAAASQEVPFSFPVLDSSEVVVKTRVTADGTEETLTETTDYTVSVNGDSGGTVTLVEALAATSEVWVIRATARTQALDLEAGGSFSAEDIEDALDKAVKLAIDNGDALDRSLRAPETDSNSLDMELPNSVDRASNYLYFDADGEPTVVASVAPETATITSYVETLLDDENAGQARATLGISTFMGTVLDDTTALAAQGTLHLDHVYDVRDYADLAAAEAAADDVGGIVYVSEDLTLTAAVTFSANVYLMVRPGATIDLDDYDLTLPSPGHVMAAPMQKLWTLSGTGVVAFADGGEVSANWWGLSPDESAENNATYLLAAITCGFANTCDVAIYGSEQDTIPLGAVAVTVGASDWPGITIRGVGRPSFDQTALTGSDVGMAFTGNASGQFEKTLTIKDLIFTGPETVLTSCHTTGSADTTTTGLSVTYAFGLVLDNVQAYRYATGIYTTMCWPVSTKDCVASYCLLGVHLAHGNTIGTHVNLESDQNWNGLYLSGKVSNQTFVSPLIQNIGNNAVTINPGGSGSGTRFCIGCSFENPYLETVDGKGFALFEDLDGVEATTGYTANLRIYGGVTSAVTGAIIAGSQGSADDVFGISINGIYGISDVSTKIIGYLRNSHSWMGNNSANGILWTWDNAGNRTLNITDDGDLAAHNQIEVGANSTKQGKGIFWDGSGGNTPGWIRLHSPNGTGWYLFVEDDGTVKIHSAAPTANTNGTVVGNQT